MHHARLPRMPPLGPEALADAVEAYRRDDDLGRLVDRVRGIADEITTEALEAAVAEYRDLPEVIIPAYESIVARRVNDAQSMVVLANAYWLTGRGPDVVGRLAGRAIEADSANRGAWHLWALAESDVRSRLERWQRVAERFPADQLARAALADNAVSLASAEHDPIALDLAIATYEELLSESADLAQRAALESTLATLRNWRV